MSDDKDRPRTRGLVGIALNHMTTSHLKQTLEGVEKKSLTVAHQTGTLGGNNNQGGGQSGGSQQGSDKK